MTERQPPTQDKAVALTYDGESAPTLSAKGEGDLAAEILAIAKEHGIPIYENPDLVNILASIELGDQIPEVLYRVIAEIIAFAYQLQGKLPEGFAERDGRLEKPAGRF